MPQDEDYRDYGDGPLGKDDYMATREAHAKRLKEIEGSVCDSDHGGG